MRSIGLSEEAGILGAVEVVDLMIGNRCSSIRATEIGRKEGVDSKEEDIQPNNGGSMSRNPHKGMSSSEINNLI
jgi:hypothetical protein